MAPVGSTAVRDVILEVQPLLGLHGHIHESSGIRRLGRTIAINPGSRLLDRRAQRGAGDARARQGRRPPAGPGLTWPRPGRPGGRPRRATGLLGGDRRGHVRGAGGGLRPRRATPRSRPGAPIRRVAPGRLGGAGRPGLASRPRSAPSATRCAGSRPAARRSAACGRIGLTGQCPSVVLVDGRGEPVTAGLIYRDNRAAAEATALRERFGDARHPPPDRPPAGGLPHRPEAALAARPTSRRRSPRRAGALQPRDLVAAGADRRDGDRRDPCRGHPGLRPARPALGRGVLRRARPGPGPLPAGPPPRARSSVGCARRSPGGPGSRRARPSSSAAPTARPAPSGPASCGPAR